MLDAAYYKPYGKINVFIRENFNPLLACIVGKTWYITERI